MYRFAICDDRDRCRNFVKAQISEIINSMGEACQIYEFTSGDSFLFHMKPGAYDICLFDVEMKGTDGIDTAKSLREIDKNTVIIFTTAHDEDVFRGFIAEPLNYLIKPLEKKELILALNKAIQKVNNSRAEKFSFKFNKSTIAVPVRNISYFESKGRLIFLNTLTETYEFYGKLADLQTDPKLFQFIRCHQSYLVNPDYIEEISNTYLTICKGSTLPIKRGQGKAVKKLFLQYIEGQLPL